MALQLPKKPTPSHNVPNMGAKQPSAPAQGQEGQDPHDNIPAFMEQNMRKASPEQQDFIKQAIMQFQPLADVFAIMIAPQAGQYVATIAQQLQQGQQNSQGGTPGVATPPGNTPAQPAGGQQPAMATPTAPQGM